MLNDKFNEWKQGVRELNKSADEIVSARDEAYRIMSDNIKNAFKITNNPIPIISFSSDASEITCKWDIGVDPIIPVNLIVDLKMPFTFNKGLNNNGEWEKILIFYPFMED